MAKTENICGGSMRTIIIKDLGVKSLKYVKVQLLSEAKKKKRAE